MPISFPASSSTPSKTTSESLPVRSAFHRATTASSASSSSGSSTSSMDTEDEEYEQLMIQEEWEESVKQMQMLLSLVLLPFFGKWMGRRWSYWAYDRYLNLGLTHEFFGIRR